MAISARRAHPNSTLVDRINNERLSAGCRAVAGARWHLASTPVHAFSTQGANDQQFLRDAAAAKVISNDPNVKADVNLQDANKADEANDPYQEALDESTTTGIHLSHDDTAKLVGLAIEHVCPTAGK
ncbi:hypothetical protein ACFXG4_17515 [Nocardia sp. NPDC059246]|uniref:hypothetical protein n=1 Tax=unclassified Nocardia TaxID=2637762 RepID=UPI0036744D6A